MTNDITFTATVYKVQTLVDGGVRVTLDLPETAIMQMAQLAECQRFGAVLDIECNPNKQNILVSNGRKSKLDKRSKRKSQRTPEEKESVHSGVGVDTQPDGDTLGWDAD